VAQLSRNSRIAVTPFLFLIDGRDEVWLSTARLLAFHTLVHRARKVWTSIAPDGTRSPRRDGYCGWGIERRLKIGTFSDSQ
jgi:hypothetical protein